MWNFDPSWPASANEMTLAAQLLACTSYIRSLWSASDEEHQWRRDEVEDALAQLARQEEVALPPTLRDLARRLANIQQLPRGAAEALLLRIEEEAKRALLADLAEAPSTAKEYVDRRASLEELPWLGSHARGIPRGWVPLFEKTAQLLQKDSRGAPDEARQTEDLKEKYGTLRWDVLGDPLFYQLAFLAEEMSEHCCLACGQSGRVDDAHGILLTLCDEHARLRAEAPRQLSDLMYEEK